jgi:hypothetical protein
MIVELARAIQTTLDTLLVQVDEAIGAANAAVTVALERGDVGAAREALETSHEYSEYRERVVYARRGWIDLQLPPEDRTAASIARIAGHTN